MFNANNILEALKNYIRARGGQSVANNIAEAVNDLNSIPQGSSGISEAPVDGKQYARKDAEWSEVQSGEDIPDEVTNAIETNGMGWTSEEEVEGFEINWDGNTEGLEYLETSDGELYKISDRFVSNKNDLLGLKFLVGEEWFEITEETLEVFDDTPDGYMLLGEYFTGMFIVYRDCTLEYEDESIQATTGIYIGSEIEGVQFTKEASTQETVHQIDSKYIPSSGGVVAVTFTIDSETGDVTASHTPAEVYELARSNMVIANEIIEDNILVLGSFISDSNGSFGFGVNGYQLEESSFRVSPYVYSSVSDMSSWNCVDW